MKKQENRVLVWVVCVAGGWVVFGWIDSVGFYQNCMLHVANAIFNSENFNFTWPF